jgi:hypothetical protein
VLFRSGGTQLVRILRDKPGSHSEISIPAERLDEFKKKHADTIGEYKFSKPFEKGGKILF